MSNEINEKELLASIGIDTTNKDLETVIEEMSDKWEELNETESYITFDEFKSKFEQEIPINEILTIKQYLPIIKKQILISNIISSAKEIDDNGMTRINYTNLELWKVVYMIENFTNYAVHPNTMIDEVDYMIENGIVDLIDHEIGSSQLWNIEGLLSKELEQIMKVENSIELIVSKHMTELQYIVSDNLDLFQNKLEVLINKVPDMTEGKMEYWLNEAKEALKSFSPKSYKTLNKVMKFAQGEEGK